jgi:hypothetical protein
MFEQGALRIVMLHLLQEKPRHGYDMIKAIEQLVDAEVARLAATPPSECPPTAHRLISGNVAKTGEAASTSKNASRRVTGTMITGCPAPAIARARGAYATGSTPPPG